MSSHLSEQEILRRQKLADLRAMGIDAYPADEFKTNASAGDIKANYERDEVKLQGHCDCRSFDECA